MRLSGGSTYAGCETSLGTGGPLGSWFDRQATTRSAGCRDEVRASSGQEGAGAPPAGEPGWQRVGVKAALRRFAALTPSVRVIVLPRLGFRPCQTTSATGTATS